MRRHPPFHATPLPAVVAVAATVLGALPLEGQAVRGRVLDDMALAPVSTARVVLLRVGEPGPDSLRAVASDVTGPDGSFRLSARGAGTFRLRAVRMGYATALSRTFRVGPSEVVTVELWMQPDAVLVEPLVVTARSGMGRSRFYRRMEEWGRGIFLTPEMVDSVSPLHPGHLLEGLEEVRVSWSMESSEAEGAGGESRPTPTVRTGLGNGCMAYMVDGRLVRPPPWDTISSPWQHFPLNALRGDDIAAVEVYRYVGEAPEEFRNAAERTEFGIPKMCGLTLFWTKEGW